MAIFYSVVKDDPLSSGGNSHTHLLSSVATAESIHVFLAG
jgi:hypothetical protein